MVDCCSEVRIFLCRKISREKYSRNLVRKAVQPNHKRINIGLSTLLENDSHLFGVLMFLYAASNRVLPSSHTTVISPGTPIAL